MKRKYRNTAQSEIAALTRQRIMEAALALFAEQWMDDVTLDQVAQRAGVTVQTILRHFGSKEGLGLQTGRMANEAAMSERAEVSPGDLAGVAESLTQQYEAIGDRVIRLLAQQDRYPDLDNVLREGRAQHQRWVERVFAPYLKNRNPEQQQRLVAQFVAASDVYVWKLMRRDMGFDVEQYRMTLLDMISALVNQ